MLRCLSLTNMPFCSMDMPIGWHGLSMPTEGNSVHMLIVITNFNVRGIKFTNISQENSNVEPREEDSNSPSSNTIGRDTTKDKHSKYHIVMPYTQRLGESIKKICSKYGIQTHCKCNKTSKQILVKPNDKNPLDKKSRVNYWYQ